MILSPKSYLAQVEHLVGVSEDAELSWTPVHVDITGAE